MIQSRRNPPPAPAVEGAEGVTHHSFSAINTYADVCQLQYRFRYVDRLPNERVGAALVFGGAINEALLSTDEDLRQARPPRKEAAFRVLHAVLEAAYADRDVPVVSTRDETLEDLGTRGERMIEHYVSVIPPDEVPLGIPRRFTVPLLDEKGEALPRPLVGEFDRVVKTKDGRLGVTDWKTAQARWSADKIAKDDQATAYLLAAPYVLGRKPDFFRYDLLLKTQKPAVERYYVERSERDLRRFIHKVRVVDKAIQAGVFVPNDLSFACPTCPFAGACGKWQG